MRAQSNIEVTIEIATAAFVTSQIADESDGIVNQTQVSAEFFGRVSEFLLRSEILGAGQVIRGQINRRAEARLWISRGGKLVTLEARDEPHGRWRRHLWSARLLLGQRSS